MATAIALHAWLWNLRTGALMAETSQVLSWDRKIQLDGPLHGSITVPASDPGMATATAGTGFGAAAIQASGLDDGTTPVPMVVELSRSGPAGVVCLRYRVQTVTRQVIDESGAAIVLEGDGMLAQYAGVVKEHINFPGCSYADVMDGAPDTIKPVITPGTSYGFVSADGTIPHLGGLFREPVGQAAWPDASKALVALTPVVDPSVGGITTYLEDKGASLLKTVQTAAARMSGDYIPGDPYPIGYRGHFYERTAS